MEKKEFLEKTAEKLSISNTVFMQLKTSYEAIGNWLNDGNELKENGGVEIRPQGSVALGTTIKPISDNDEYDVDLICKINNYSLKGFPERVKNLVGNRLKENNKYLHVEEGKRCWTYQYANYHLDILPCIPSTFGDSLVATQKINNVYSEHSTNPIGYRKWFFTKCLQIQLLEEKKMEPLINHEEKTNLQKIVQLLKRHRDSFMVKENPDDKPISIIITTLAASVYKNINNNLYEEFIYVVRTMDSIFKKDSNGNYILLNPVDSNENFADKWIIYPSRKNIFFKWLECINQDINNLDELNSQLQFSKLFKKMFGENITNVIYEEYGNSTYEKRNNSELRCDKNGQINLTEGNKINQHIFYGK